MLRRPIIVYAVKYVKNYRGDRLGYTNFEGNTFNNYIIHLKLTR